MPNPPPEQHHVAEGRRPTPEQQMYLLCAMEKNIAFSQGEFFSGMGKDDHRREWENLKKSLERFPNAAIKSVSKWQKYWSDQRNAVKRRAREVRNHHDRGTGGGYPTHLLTNYQQRVLTCMGGWKRVVGISSAKEVLNVR
ncbi:Putative phosphatase MG263 [Frankliniella fusca]|uniref:Phosphatase MG263 n=1 Tax=Frankliniella fusca TaxID=407009 RepID=A0AAE1H8E0_9NEOP|nr:Putative phosphatase MG263 [Frankliniella fusca]